MGGTTLAVARRTRDPLFARVFGDPFTVPVSTPRRRAIDVGGGPDALAWPNLDVIVWDLPNDAHDLSQFDDVFDVGYSSHCLEHVTDPRRCMSELWRVVKPGGFVVVVVPDWQLYERGKWPPAYNGDHKRRFTTHPERWIFSEVTAGNISVAGLMSVFSLLPIDAELLSLRLLDDGFNPHTDRDQTADGTCECGIEVVVRKPV